MNRYSILTGFARAGGRQEAVGRLDDDGGQVSPAMHGHELPGQDARIDPADFGEAQANHRTMRGDHQADGVHMGRKQHPRARLGAAPAASGRAGCPAGCWKLIDQGTPGLGDDLAGGLFVGRKAGQGNQGLRKGVSSIIRKRFLSVSMGIGVSDESLMGVSGVTELVSVGVTGVSEEVGVKEGDRG